MKTFKEWLKSVNPELAENVKYPDPPPPPKSKPKSKHPMPKPVYPGSALDKKIKARQAKVDADKEAGRQRKAAFEKKHGRNPFGDL